MHYSSTCEFLFIKFFFGNVEQHSHHSVDIVCVDTNIAFKLMQVSMYHTLEEEKADVCYIHLTLSP